MNEGEEGDELEGPDVHRGRIRDVDADAVPDDDDDDDDDNEEQLVYDDARRRIITALADCGRLLRSLTLQVKK
jgi:hypothetical protein